MIRLIYSNSSFMALIMCRCAMNYRKFLLNCSLFNTLYGTIQILFIIWHSYNEIRRSLKRWSAFKVVTYFLKRVSQSNCLSFKKEKKRRKSDISETFCCSGAVYLYKLERASQDQTELDRVDIFWRTKCITIRQEPNKQICARRLGQFFGFERSICCRSCAVRKQIFFNQIGR